MIEKIIAYEYIQKINKEANEVIYKINDQIHLNAIKDYLTPISKTKINEHSKNKEIDPTR